MRFVALFSTFALSALLFMGCSGSDGNSCTVATLPSGGATITCEDGTSATIENGADGTNGTAGEMGAMGETGAMGAMGAMGTMGTMGEAGMDGSSCSVTDNGDGTSTISCDDGTSADVADGTTCGVTLEGCDVDLACDGSDTVTIPLKPSISLGTVEVTSNFGGEGSDPYDVSCADGSVVVGISGAEDSYAGGSIGILDLVCAPTEAVCGDADRVTIHASGVFDNAGAYALMCPAGGVVTAIPGNAAGVIVNLSIECRLPDGTTTVVGPVNDRTDGAFDARCPGDKVLTGLQGNGGAAVDGFQMKCR